MYCIVKCTPNKGANERAVSPRGSPCMITFIHLHLIPYKPCIEQKEKPVLTNRKHNSKRTVLNCTALHCMLQNMIQGSESRTLVDKYLLVKFDNNKSPGRSSEHPRLLHPGSGTTGFTPVPCYHLITPASSLLLSAMSTSTYSPDE